MRVLASLFLAVSMLGAPLFAASLCDERLLREALPANLSQDRPWRRLVERDGLCIWSRSRYSDQVKEVAAAALIDAPPRSLARLIVDCRQISKVFRDVSACRELRSDGNDFWIFQKIDLPWPAQDRYFTVKTRLRSSAGGSFEVDWTLADEGANAPHAEGVAAKRNTGRWRFRAADAPAGGALALYYLSVDPGGSIALPNWIVDFGHQPAVPNMINDCLLYTSDAADDLTRVNLYRTALSDKQKKT